MNQELTRELYQLLAYAVRRLGRTTIDNLKAQREILKIAELMTGPLVGALGLELVDPEGTEKLLADIRNVLSKLEERRGR